MRVKPLDTLIIDYETYWAADFTLRDLPTSDYVRSPEFKIHMVAVKYKNNGTRVFHDMKKFKEWLDKIDPATVAMVGHNLYFDGFITTQHFNFIPARYICTMSMSKALWRTAGAHDLDSVAKRCSIEGKVEKGSFLATKGVRTLPKELREKVAVYNIGDVDATTGIYQFMAPYVPPFEMDLIDTTVRMFCAPVIETNRELLREAHAEAIAQRDDLLNKAATIIAQYFPDQDPIKVLGSANKMVELLEHLDAQVPYKISPRTDKLTPAFSKKDTAFLELMESDPVVRTVCEARMAVKSKGDEARAARLIEATAEHSTLPIMYIYCGAHTTRWSAGNKMNLQNLRRGGKLRKALLAPKGNVLMTGDSGQIEARITAMLAGQFDLVEGFRQKQDVYCGFATDLFGRTVTKEDELERHIGKTCILGLGYGMGHVKLIDTLATSFIPVTMEAHESRAAVELYRSKYHRIPELWKYHDDILFRMAHGESGHIEYDCGLKLKFEPDRIWLPNGLALIYPDLQITYGDEGRRTGYTYAAVQGRNLIRKKIYGGLLTENIVQALARLVVAEQLWMMRYEHGYTVVMMTHDEMTIVVKNTKAAIAKALKLMDAEMSTPPDWLKTLPVATEIKYGVHYVK